MYSAHMSHLQFLTMVACVAALGSGDRVARAESGSGARPGPIVVVVGMKSCCPQEAWAEAEIAKEGPMDLAARILDAGGDRKAQLARKRLEELRSGGA